MKRWLAIAIALTVTFTIAGMGQSLCAQIQPQPRTPQRLGAAAPPPACCSVTVIDSRTGVVTAKENANGRMFEFRATNAALLATFHPGSPVYANFSAKQVSLDGKTACCPIIRIGASPGEKIPADTLAHSAAAARCPQPWLTDHLEYKGLICISADATRPAILLLHGLHQTGESWTRPSSVGFNYDFRHAPPEADLGSHAGPNAGLYKAGTSAVLDVDPLNWFDYLVKQGFTVATWNQPCCTLDKAYPSATEALAQFAALTAAMKPPAPPPIALIGHSRGGLVIHKLLRYQGNLGGRIRWVITIHSPHHGTEVARTPQVIAEQASELFAGVELPADVKNPLKEIALHLVSPLNQLIDDGSKELAPGSALITGLQSGDAPVPGVQYFTFGGVSPTLARLYTWWFTPMSSVPQYKKLEQYFVWQVKPAEVGLVSPLLDRERAIVPELKAGQGDSLVTDLSARLPYATHETDSLNHAEVLWNRPLQEKVAQILFNSLAPNRAPKP